SAPILDVVDGYRGEPARLIDFDNWYTIPEARADTRVKSQRWHRDPWDNHIVKVFVYFSDVDEEAGPFEYVPGSAAGGRYGDLGQRRLPARDGGLGELDVDRIVDREALPPVREEGRDAAARDRRQRRVEHVPPGDLEARVLHVDLRQRLVLARVERCLVLRLR